MVVLTESELKSKKKSNTLFILGSGYSINEVTIDEWNKINAYDSMGFNWFCKHKFEPSFFLIREQANLPSRHGELENVDIFINSINRYKNTVGIISDVSNHTRKAYRYKDDKRINIPCAIVSDNKDKRCIKNVRKYLSRNPFEIGLYHGDCTMYNVLHFAKFMDYKQIVFVGVDLYNSQYFWLSADQSRYTLRNKGLTWKNKHPVKDNVLHAVAEFRTFGISMFSTNPQSLLNKYIPTISILDIKDKE